MENQKAVKKLSPEQYARAKAMWASGRYTLVEISRTFDISVQGITRRFKKDGVTKGMDNDKHAKAVEQAMENSIVNEAEKIAKIISEEKETTLRLSDQIRKRAAFEIAKVTRDQVPLAAAESGLKTLKLFQQIVDGAYGISSRVLGIERIDEKSSEIPTLRIEEMTDADVEEIREIQRKQMQELIEGDLDGMLTDEEVEVDESLSGSEGVVARPDTANEDEDMS